MKFKSNFLYNYLTEAPVSLAIERTLECEILSRQDFIRPILDIGCGEGLFAYILFDEKIDVGIDPYGRELKRCKHFEMYKELIQCNGDNIPKQSKSFNTIFSNSTIEHIPDIDKVLQEANRLLSDNGKLYITVPTNFFDKYTVGFQILSFFGLKALAEKYRVFFNKFWNHDHYYDIEGWEKLFQKNGFVILNHRNYNSKFICMLNGFLNPFSIYSFLVKKITNRWFLFPSVRKIIARILCFFIKGIIYKDIDEKAQKQGLVFCEIIKDRGGL